MILVDDGHAVGSAHSSTIHAVVANVQSAAFKPAKIASLEILVHHPSEGFHPTKRLRLLGAESFTVRSNGTLVHGIVHSSEKRGELLSVQIFRLKQLKLHCSFNAPLDVPDHVPVILCGILSANVTEILIGDA